MNIYPQTDLSELLGSPHDGDLELLEGGTDDALDVVRQDPVLRVQLGLVDVDRVVRVSAVLPRARGWKGTYRHSRRD